MTFLLKLQNRQDQALHWQPSCRCGSLTGSRPAQRPKTRRIAQTLRFFGLPPTGCREFLLLRQMFASICARKSGTDGDFAVNELNTCFKRVEYDLSGLLHYIEIGDIGLPDIQRPFVWSNAKVRDLFDSMYRGFPVGYLLFWENEDPSGVRKIGTGSKQRKVAARLIIDGQQRLTSLYAVFRGQKVLDADYRERQIEIAFRPRDGRFEVADATIRRDPEWVPNLSDLWSSGNSSRKLVNNFIERLTEKTDLSDEDEEVIAQNLDRLFDLQKYPFTALEIAPTVDEEQVSDIFVRINSKGVSFKSGRLHPDVVVCVLGRWSSRSGKFLSRITHATRASFPSICVQPPDSARS